MYPSSTQAYSALQAFKPRSTQDVMGEAETKYGLPEARTRLSNLRGLVGNLQSSVEAVDPSVTGRTSGSFVTEGARQALVNKERAPILGDLGKQQGALGQEESSFNTSSSLASQMASALMNQDHDTYQRLLDQYNASSAAEKAAEEKRQYETTLAEQRRQFNASQAAAARAAKASGAGSYNLGSLLGGAAKSAPKTDPIQQQAYNDVNTRINSQSDEELMSDYLATASSAKYGNAKDLVKLQLYRQLKPGLFKTAYSWEQAGGARLANSPTY